MKIQSFIHPDSFTGLKISPPPFPRIHKGSPNFFKATGRILRFQQMNVKVLLWCEGVDLSKLDSEMGFFRGIPTQIVIASHIVHTHPPKINEGPLKKELFPIGNFMFQSLIFRGHVSFQGSNALFWVFFSSGCSGNMSSRPS